MTTREIREALTEKRALYREHLAKSADARAHIQEVFNSFDDDTVKELLSMGVDLRPMLHDFDLERMKTDKAYTIQCQEYLDKQIQTLHSYLEDSLK